MDRNRRYQLVRGPGAAHEGWRAEMSPRLRIAAEWQFGTPLLLILVFLIKGNLGGLLVTAIMAVIFWLGLSYKFAQNRTAWWVTVALFSGVWLFGAIGILTTPSS
jgi:hypothetical protein